MNPRALVAALALLAAVPAFAAGGGDERVRARTGAACERITGEPLYREVHEERWEGGRIVEDRVTYHRPGGEVFATKPVDFRADAGFDRFIERSWDRLVAGEAVVRPFLIPSRLGTVDMRIRRLRRAGGRDVEFELVIDSALRRLVVPAIRVRYDASTRWLFRYEGVSNLRAGDGTNPDVKLNRPWPGGVRSPRGPAPLSSKRVARLRQRGRSRVHGRRLHRRTRNACSCRRCRVSRASLDGSAAPAAVRPAEHAVQVVPGPSRAAGAPTLSRT